MESLAIARAKSPPQSRFAARSRPAPSVSRAVRRSLADSKRRLLELPAEPQE